MINDLEDPLLSVPDVAELLNISPRAVRRLLTDGHISHFQLTETCRRVAPAHLADYLAQRMRTADGLK